MLWVKAVVHWPLFFFAASKPWSFYVLIYYYLVKSNGITWTWLPKYCSRPRFSSEIVSQRSTGLILCATPTCPVKEMLKINIKQSSVQKVLPLWLFDQVLLHWIAFLPPPLSCSEANPPAFYFPAQKQIPHNNDWYCTDSYLHQDLVFVLVSFSSCCRGLVEKMLLGLLYLSIVLFDLFYCWIDFFYLIQKYDKIFSF